MGLISKTGDIQAKPSSIPRQHSEIHMRRDVLLADAFEWVAIYPMLMIAEQSAIRAVRSVVVGLGVAVVDRQQEAALENPCHLLEPGRPGQADLGTVSFREWLVAENRRKRLGRETERTRFPTKFAL